MIHEFRMEDLCMQFWRFVSLSRSLAYAIIQSACVYTLYSSRMKSDMRGNAKLYISQSEFSDKRAARETRLVRGVSRQARLN